MNEKRRKYAREWARKRYVSDPEFRKKRLEVSARWNKLHPRTRPLTPEEHVRVAKLCREWRKKYPEKVKAYTKKRMSTPRLQISQTEGRIRYYQKLLAKLKAQVKLEVPYSPVLEAPRKMNDKIIDAEVVRN